MEIGMENVDNEICIAAIDNSDEILLDCDLGGGVGDGDDLDTITPKVGMEFPSQVDAYKFYNRYAFKLGFGTRWSSTVKSKADPTLVISRRFVCSKEGKKSKPTADKEVQHRREIRVGCKAMMKILRLNSGSWRVCIFLGEELDSELKMNELFLKWR